MILMSIIRGGTACLQPPATSNATIYLTCITCSIFFKFPVANLQRGSALFNCTTGAWPRIAIAKNFNSVKCLSCCRSHSTWDCVIVITHFLQFYLLHNPNRSHQILICDVEILGSNNDKGGQNAFLYHH